MNLSDALSRFVLPNLSASSSAHSVLVQIIHAMQDEPSHVTGVFLIAPITCTCVVLSSQVTIWILKRLAVTPLSTNGKPHIVSPMAT